MANKQKGEVSFEADGKRYTLAFSINALCVLEAEFEDMVAEVDALMARRGRRRVTTLRTVFWAGLSDHHPELSKKDAGALMTALGFNEALEAAAKAMMLAYPGGTADPLAEPVAPAANGTGQSS